MTTDTAAASAADQGLPRATPGIRLNLGFWVGLATVSGVALAEFLGGAAITSVLGWVLAGSMLNALARCQLKSARLIFRCGQLDGLVESVTKLRPRWPDRPWPALFLIAETSTSSDRTPHQPLR